MLVYLRSPVVCFLLSMDEMSCITEDKPYADIRKKKSKSCHHQVPAHQQDRKEATGLECEASTRSHGLCQMEHFYMTLQLKPPAEPSILQMG